MSQIVNLFSVDDDVSFSSLSNSHEVLVPDRLLCEEEMDPASFSFLFETFVFCRSFKNIIYLFLAVLGLCCCTGFSFVVVSRGHSLVAALRLPAVGTSLVVEHRL